MLLSKVVAHSDLVLGPHGAGLVVKPPRLHHLKRIEEFRASSPQEQDRSSVAGRSEPSALISSRAIVG